MRRAERLDAVAEQVRNDAPVTSPQATSARRSAPRTDIPSVRGPRSRTARTTVRRPSGTIRDARNADRIAVRAGRRPVIGKITAPRGERVEPLIWYLYGPGRQQEHTDPHIVAGWRHPAELEPPLRPDGTRDFRTLNGLLNQPHAALGQARVRPAGVALLDARRPRRQDAQR